MVFHSATDLLLLTARIKTVSIEFYISLNYEFRHGLSFALNLFHFWFCLRSNIVILVSTSAAEIKFVKVWMYINKDNSLGNRIRSPYLIKLLLLQLKD